MAVLPGDDSWLWIDSTGSVLDFTDRTKWGVMTGDGMGVVDTEIVERQTPYGPGAQFLYARPKPRDLVFRVFIKAVDWPTQQNLRQQLVTAFSPWKGQAGATGSLRVTRANGSVRQIDCVATKLPFNAQGRLGVARREEVALRASNPLWYDPTPVTVTLPVGGSTGGTPLTYPQTLPFILGGATGTGVAAASTTNVGDWEGYPTITVTGPCSNPVVANNTAGKALAWTGTVASGQTLQFVCSLTNPSVTLTDASGNVFNVFSGLSTASQFWTVLPGVNLLSFSSSGAGTQPTVTYYARFSGI